MDRGLDFPSRRLPPPVVRSCFSVNSSETSEIGPAMTVRAMPVMLGVLAILAVAYR